jgi:hypothetical protein
MPMGMADIAEVLWRHHLKHNPANPRWADRDRFVLSNGHGSMLLYALLHLSGYDLPIEELQRFRQLHSKTPGHPEFGITPGSKRPPGRSGRGWPTLSAWRLRSVCWRRPSTAGAPDRRPLHLCFHRRRLSDGRGFARSLLAGRTLVAVQVDRLL